MKKNYFLTLLLTIITAASFGQVILAEDFSYPDGSLVPNGGWAREGGTAGDFQVTGGKAVVQHGTPSEDVKKAFTPVAGDIYAGFDFSVDDLGAPFSGTDAEYFAHFDFKARIDIQAPTGAGDYTIGISSSSSTAEATWASDLTFGTIYRAIVKFDQVTGTAQLWINPTMSSDTSISGTGTSAFSLGEFELRQSDSSENETVRIDDLMIGQTFNDVLVFATPTAPALTITTPANGTEFAPGTTSVDVSLTVQNFTFSADNGSGMSDSSGDGYIKQTLVSPAGTFTENKFNTSTVMISVANNESYTVTMELVDNSGASLSPAVSQTTSFSVASIAQAADIAALRAGTNNEYYELTGQAIVTYVVGNSRNQIYIQDASGAILIDDNDGTITTALTVGDGITGLKGRLGSFSGISQFVPTEDSGAPTATGQSFTTTSVTMNDFVTNFENYESEWVKIESATFTDANGVAMFDSTTTRNYNITEGADSMVMRIQFDGTNLEGAVIPSGANSITGIAAQFNTTIQIFPIELSGIVLGLGSVNQIEGFGAFPNPVQNKELTISSSSSDAKQVTIYNVLGRKVLSQKFSGTQKTINISSVNTGIYILKVVENGKISTKKLVVK